MENIIPILVALIGSGIWSVLFDMWKTKHNKKTAEQKMLIALGHSIIFSKAQYYLDRGYIEIDELDDLAYVYNAYKSLGGNGTGEQLYEKICKLPNKKEN